METLESQRDDSYAALRESVYARVNAGISVLKLGSRAAVRVIIALCLIVLGFPARSDAQETPACIDPPPSDEALVRGAVEWMLPDRSIEIPEFEIGSSDAAGGTRARLIQAGAGLSLMPFSRSVSHPRTDEFSISATMNLAATLRVDYTGVSVAGSCDLTVQGPLAMRDR